MSFERRRVAVVGARRRRQGTGPFVARELLRNGCELVAVVGTTPASAAAAAAELAAAHGVSPRPYASLEAALAAEELDAVAICSPAEAHEAALGLAAAAGCHVLCEKPLVWSDALLQKPAAEADAELAARIRAIVRPLAEARRTLVLGAQWPHTLPAFRRLHPDAYGPERPVERFTMWLGPARDGARMVVDSGSHPISMVQALCGPGSLEELCVERLRGEVDGWDLRWTHAGARPVAVRLELRRCPAAPRPAGYAINGLAVQRHIELPRYALSFAAGDVRTPVYDPLAASVEGFVRQAAEGTPPDVDALIEGMVHLRAVAAAAAAQEGT